MSWVQLNNILYSLPSQLLVLYVLLPTCFPVILWENPYQMWWMLPLSVFKHRKVCLSWCKSIQSMERWNKIAQLQICSMWQTLRQRHVNWAWKCFNSRTFSQADEWTETTTRDVGPKGNKWNDWSFLWLLKSVNLNCHKLKHFCAV